MLRFVSVNGAAPIPVSVAERLRKGEDEVWTSRYLYRVIRSRVVLQFVEYGENLVIRYPIRPSDTSAALVVARAIDE